MQQTYQHSGRFTKRGVVAGLFGGSALGIAAAYLYAWGIPYIPEAKLAFIATMAFGMTVGAATAFPMTWLKVRSAKVAVVTGLVTATVSWYCSWVFWLCVILHRYSHTEVNPLAMMLQPAAMWDVIQAVNRFGTWGTTANSPTTGTELWIIWFFEGVTVIGLGALTAVGLINWTPFCETCDRWCGKKETLRLSPVDDIQQFQQQLQAHDLAFLDKLGAGSTKESHLLAELNSCPQCHQLNVLSVKQIYIQKKKLGGQAVKNVDLATRMLISQPEADKFRQAALRLNQVAKAKGAHA